MKHLKLEKQSSLSSVHFVSSLLTMVFHLALSQVDFKRLCGFSVYFQTSSSLNWDLIPDYFLQGLLCSSHPVFPFHMVFSL